jgi:hypothetical protein
MGDFEADTLRDSIESGWALTGALVKTESTTVQNPVKFFAHSLVKHTEVKRAVIVRKLSPISSDVNHTEFKEVNDVFEITSRYTVDATNETAFDLSEQRVEDMCNEVDRIIKTIYEPQTATGGFYVTNFSWRNDDEIDKLSQVLLRTLTLTLKKLVAKSTEVFEGFGGILKYDTSASEGSNKPGADYTYTSVYKVIIHGGYKVIKEEVHGNNKIPKRFTGNFSGMFECDLYAKKSDINGTTDEDLTKLGTLNAQGELNEVVFLKTALNTESTPITLTESIKVQIVDFNRIYDDKELIEFRLIGDVVERTTFSVA